MMWGWHVDMGWGWWVFGPVMMIGFWGIVAWAIVSLIRSNEPTRSPRLKDSARGIADQRLASGEIDEEEHGRIVERLERSHQTK